MEINLNVKIRGGPRTPVDVAVYGTAVNSKTLRFANGKSVSEDAIAQWIETNLSEVLSLKQDEK